MREKRRACLAHFFFVNLLDPGKILFLKLFPRVEFTGIHENVVDVRVLHGFTPVFYPPYIRVVLALSFMVQFDPPPIRRLAFDARKEKGLCPNSLPKADVSSRDSVVDNSRKPSEAVAFTRTNIVSMFPEFLDHRIARTH